MDLLEIYERKDLCQIDNANKLDIVFIGTYPITDLVRIKTAIFFISKHTMAHVNCANVRKSVRHQISAIFH